MINPASSSHVSRTQQIDRTLASADPSSGGGSFADMLSALQNLPGLGNIVPAAVAGAITGGPAGAAGAAAASAVGDIVSKVAAALNPGEPKQGYAMPVPARSATLHVTGNQDVRAQGVLNLTMAQGADKSASAGLPG